MNYASFLEEKRIIAQSQGFEPQDLGAIAFPYQQDLVTAACRSGRFGLFANTGLGKTLMEGLWAKEVLGQCGRSSKVLILAPLAVAHQTVEELAKFGILANLCEGQSDVEAGINITNYEKLHKFSGSWDGLILDEASVIKNHSSATFKQLTEFGQHIPYRLAATATPSPNDYMELACYCEFLGVMSRAEMLSTFFRHDSTETAKWRLSHWGKDKFWEFLLSWSAVVRRPSDLGYDDTEYQLPPLEQIEHVVFSDWSNPGELASIARSQSERREARKASLQARCEALAALVNQSAEPWLLWCDYNPEGDLLEQLIPDAVQVAGRHTDEQKCDRMIGFAHGEHRVLVSKPSIAGFGMNWQHCRNVAFVGISDSWEQQRQATARCHRYGQTQTVYKHLFYSAQEQLVLQNLKRKAEQEEELWTGFYATLQRLGLNQKVVQRQSVEYAPNQPMELPQWLAAA